MLPRAMIGDIKPENWLGFIDAIYAIILTLLLIELPSLLLDLIKEFEHHPSFHFVLLQSFALSFFGYLSIFAIVYDIWAHHRMLVVEASMSRVNSAIGAFMLFMCSLVPPVYYIISHLRHDFLLGVTHPIGIYSTIYGEVRMMFFFNYPKHLWMHCVDRHQGFAGSTAAGSVRVQYSHYQAIKGFQRCDAAHHRTVRRHLLY